MYRTVFLVACVALMSPTPVTAQQCLSKKVINNECETYTLTSMTHNQKCRVFEASYTRFSFFLKPGPSFNFLEVVITKAYSSHTPTVKGKINSNKLSEPSEWYHIEMTEETIDHTHIYRLYVNGHQEYWVWFPANKASKIAFNIKGSPTYGPSCKPRPLPTTGRTPPPRTTKTTNPPTTTTDPNITENVTLAVISKGDNNKPLEEDNDPNYQAMSSLLLYSLGGLGVVLVVGIVVVVVLVTRCKKRSNKQRSINNKNNNNKKRTTQGTSDVKTEETSFQSLDNMRDTPQQLYPQFSQEHYPHSQQETHAYSPQQLYPQLPQEHYPHSQQETHAYSPQQLYPQLPEENHAYFPQHLHSHFPHNVGESTEDPIYEEVDEVWERRTEGDLGRVSPHDSINSLYESSDNFNTIYQEGGRKYEEGAENFDRQRVSDHESINSLYMTSHQLDFMYIQGVGGGGGGVSDGRRGSVHDSENSLYMSYDALQ
ncbi:hypothetical protein Pmani_011477 [Petrolisthes manimaculis]|uniref:Uncharacterized protein n=2 Tax=Petrolisthes manimaculis TaxID=1843537 RepID=A0AAE1UBJ4_9EUCA|nr:hypothetical protein Pmani_011477 [Petrolisthes manimaculis]